MLEFTNIADLKDPNDAQSRSYREVNNSTQHKFNIGEFVEIDDGVRMYIAMQNRDCDGTPLYCLTPFKNDYSPRIEGYRNTGWISGLCEDDMQLVDNH